MRDMITSALFNIKVIIRGILYRLQYAFQFYSFRRSLDILTSEETIDKIIEQRCSVCRFGDGELDMITSLSIGYDESRKSNFQKFEPALAERLQEVLRIGYNLDLNVLVCIPYVWKNSRALRPKPRFFVQRSFVNNHKKIRDEVTADKTYGDSYFSRFYMDFKNRDKADYIKRIQKLWDARNVCIVEGDQSRLGVGNDLFNNAAKIERVLCPAVNAYGKYNEILEEVCKLSKDKLILLALGQTATILAFDLAKRGYQAVDIGHIDVEYEWFLMGAQEKVALPNKFVNEVDSGRCFTRETDTKYNEEIICKIN